MRAAVVKKYGGTENFEVQDWPHPAVKPGECLIRVRAVGINFADLMQRMGVYPGTPKPPFIPGFEVAGTVEKAPDTGKLRAGDRVVVHGAAGGVGVAAVQLAKARGVEVFGTAGPSKQDFLRTIGVEHPIDYSREDFVQAVRRAAPKGIEMVLDPIGGKSWARSYACLGMMGRLVVFGFSAAAGASGKRSLPRAMKAFLQTPRFSPLQLMERNVAVIGVHLGRMAGREAVLGREMEEVMRMYAAGQIQPVVGKTFVLEQAAEAHRYLHNRRNVGKVVLRVGSA